MVAAALVLGWACHQASSGRVAHVAPGGPTDEPEPPKRAGKLLAITAAWIAAGEAPAAAARQRRWTRRYASDLSVALGSQLPSWRKVPGSGPGGVTVGVTRDVTFGLTTHVRWL
jgi:hypothetical protein